MSDKKIELVQRIEFLKNISKGKKVFHLGCTNYPFTNEVIESGSHLHIELGKYAEKLYGLDYDQKGIDILNQRGIGDIFQGDLENLGAVPLDETFDVIIAGEMIEHLNNPGLFLEGIKRFMNPNTRLVITTINAYGALRFVYYFLRGKGGVNEAVHSDHVAYYSYSTLSLLLRRHQLEVNEFLFYDLGEEHRDGGKWYYKLINDLAVKFTPQMADGVIAVCRLGKV